MNYFLDTEFNEMGGEMHCHHFGRLDALIIVVAMLIGAPLIVWLIEKYNDWDWKRHPRYGDMRDL